MKNRPITLAAVLVVLAWVFAAAPVEAGGRKFSHRHGNKIWQHYDEHSIHWRGHSTYPERYRRSHHQRSDYCCFHRKRSHRPWGIHRSHRSWGIHRSHHYMTLR